MNQLRFGALLLMRGRRLGYYNGRHDDSGTESRQDIRR